MKQEPMELLLSPSRLAGARRPLPQATTLPADAFTSPSVYGAEFERIFEREWLCAGRVDQIPDRGDYFTLDLLGEKLVVVRDRNETIRVMSRICRHRAAELVRGAGNARSFQCPYHAWTFGTDGRLIGAPMMDGAEGFDRKTCRLPEIRSEVWEGWIFVNFDAEAAPLGPQLAPLSKQLSGCSMSEMVAIETATYDSRFNWKVLVDNFMEAYHHIATHRDTLEQAFPGEQSYSPDNQGPYSVLVMPDRATTPSPLGDLPRVQAGDAQNAGPLVAAVVYPFHLFAPTPESLTWYQLLPHGHDRFTLKIFSCFPRDVLQDPAHAAAVEGLQTFTKVIHEQDIQACEAVWAGLASRTFDTGPLCPLEKPIWQFNQWWTERMEAAV